MARTEQFADEAHVMKVLYQDYTKRTDFDTMAIVDQDIAEILQTCASRERDVRDTIYELSQQVRELEATAAYPHPEGQHAERLAALQRKIEITKRQIEELQEDSRSAEQHCHEVEGKIKEAEALHTESINSLTAEEQLIRHKLSMYAHVTRVTWRVDQGSTVAGTVCDTKSGDIRQFHFNPDTVTKFELVNALWELL